MKNKFSKVKVVLALDPATKGFGFALFEGPLRPIDWGVKDARKNKNATSLRKIKELIKQYQPSVIVVEDYSGEGSRRCKRVRRLIRDIIALASKNNISTRRYSRGMIREYFSQFGAVTKFEISRTIAKWLPEFEPRLPPFRKPWMNEDDRMSIFDAVSLALTYFYFETKKKRAA